jgi:hypothetical protein
VKPLVSLILCLIVGDKLMADQSLQTFPPLDLTEGAALLSGAQFALPSETAQLWRDDDGLPTPDDPAFATAAASFAAEHPVPPPDRRGPTDWDTRPLASRQLKLLAYLGAGGQDRRREMGELCLLQAEGLQFRLPIRTGHGRSLDNTFCAATTALALTGDLLRRRAEPGTVLHQVATQWLRTGLGQFLTYIGRVKAGNGEAARAVIDSLGISPESLALHGNDEEFFAEIDLTRPDMRQVAAAVARGDWEAAKEAYVQALTERFSRKRGWPDVLFSRAVDLVEADDICRNIFILQAHMFRRYDFGETVDWAKVIGQDIESRVWMNAHPWMWTLLNAYSETGDHRYVDHLCRLFESWYDTSPPSFTRTDAQWRTLEVGGRLGQKWPPVLLGLSGDPTFRRECLFDMARSELDHAKYLCMYAAGGGNWLQVESSGLACAALLFPEFKLFPVFYEVAMDRLAWANAQAFLPDGFQSECSPGYHRFPLIGMASALRLAHFLGTPVPAGMMAQYEAGVEAMEYIAYPDGTLPMLSDASPRRESIATVLTTGAEVFGRDDFRWFATDGRKGKPPAQPSHDFTHAGYCVMRDKWGPEGEVLIFDAGYFGAGHQHEDKLSFVYYAGGRELIGDPGIYSYKRNEFEPYWRGSWSHNTVVVDDLSQHRGLGPAEEMPDPDRRFVIGDGFHYAEGWYRRAYSPRGSRPGQPDRDAAIRDVHHQRCVFLLSRRCAVIADRVLGEGEHQVDVLFHPSPIVTAEGAKGAARPVEVQIGADRSVVTREPAHANVAIIPAWGPTFQVLDLLGPKNPVRGWFALYGIQPSHDIVYRYRGPLPQHFETLIQPLPPGPATPMRARPVPVVAEEGRTCAAVECDEGLFLLSYDGPTTMTCEEVRFEGTALFLQRDRSGRPTRAHTVDGKLLTLAGRQAFATDTPAPAQSLDLRTAR